jgi:5'-methylthioadenosine phosphorylase
MNGSGGPAAELAVIGGSGFYSFLEPEEEFLPETPWGLPSDPIVLARLAGRRVAFVARHGRDHRFPPHRIPYRANLWALRELGVTQVLAPCAVGSLTRELGAGTLAVPDQLVDRTSGRAQTFYDEAAVHVAFADPYCPTGRATALDAARSAGWPAVDGGTLVVVEGPRFSTRAESGWFAGAGWTLIGMTGHPEAVLARELAMCYTAVCLVTDLDAGLQPQEAVSQEEVFRVFGEHVDRLRDLVATVAENLPGGDCSCRHAVDGLPLPFPLPGPR